MAPLPPDNGIDDPKGLQQLLDKIYLERGIDFRGYSKSSIGRRISRRLLAQGVDNFADYVKVLDQHPGEYDPLFNDITINVTQFFRDESAFKAFEKALELIW